MKFSMNPDVWNVVFAVPAQLVDQHLKLAGGVHLKVLLWLLRHAGNNINILDITQVLGISPADIKDAIQYWVTAGLITNFTDDDFFNETIVSNTITENKTTMKQKENLLSESAENPETLIHTMTVQTIQKKEASTPIVTGSVSKLKTRMKKPDSVYISQRMTQCSKVSFLMQEAQQILGRILSPALSSSLLMIHDDYGLPVEVICTLLTYVKSIHKDNTSYIEAVAKNWANEEINTLEKANAKIEQLSTIAKSWRHIEKVLGINHRSPSAKEEQYTYLWMHQWNFTPDMIRQAYERCVDATGKLSLHYMNKILERWYKANIITQQQAQAEEKVSKQQEKQKPTYDLDEFEKIDLDELM